MTALNGPWHYLAVAGYHHIRDLGAGACDLADTQARLALAALALVRYLEANPEFRPPGWGEDPADGSPHPDPSSRQEGWRVFTCTACGAKFGTNCAPGDIACPDCEARLCPQCGHWEQAAT